MITALYAGLLGLLYAKLSLDTIQARRKHRISLGVGPNGEIEQIVSAHGNFAAYASMLILQLGMLELCDKMPVYAIHAFGLTMALGRGLHYAAFRSNRMNFKLRVLGMHLTLWPLILMSAMNVVFAWGK